jgi:hypothetical protein
MWYDCFTLKDGIMKATNNRWLVMEGNGREWIERMLIEADSVCALDNK